MAMNIKRGLVILLGICMLIGCTGCNNAKISSLKVKDTSIDSICVGETSAEMTVEVEYFRSFQTGDVNVVIEDNSIIDIDYEAKEAMLSGYYLSFAVTGLKAGTTSFYFETTDGTVKSDTVEIEVVTNNESIDKENPSDNTEHLENQALTFEVVRKFVELYNEKIDPDIVDGEEIITEDNVLKYDGAFSIEGNINGEYILVMNFGASEIKDGMRIDSYFETPEGILEMLQNVSLTIGKPLTDNDSNNIVAYFNECFGDNGKGYTEWTSVGGIKYFSRYLSQGKTYELQIEFSVDSFFE